MSFYSRFPVLFIMNWIIILIHSILICLYKQLCYKSLNNNQYEVMDILSYYTKNELDITLGRCYRVTSIEVIKLRCLVYCQELQPPFTIESCKYLGKIDKVVAPAGGGFCTVWLSIGKSMIFMTGFGTALAILFCCKNFAIFEWNWIE